MTKMAKKSCRVTSIADILSATNPEIFETSPRPGGFLKVLVPSKSQDYIALGGPTHGAKCTCKLSSRGRDSMHGSNVSIGSTHSRSSRFGMTNVPQSTQLAPGFFPHTPSREFRISESMKDPDWMNEDEDDDAAITVSNPYADAMDMLASTISCVMLMAAGLSNIPEEYLSWTEHYLECMTDDEDNYAYNTLGILNHISYLRQGKKGDRKKCKGSKCAGSKKCSKGKNAERKSSRSASPRPPSAPPSVVATPVISPRESRQASPNVSRDNVRTLTTVKGSTRDTRPY